MPSSGGRVHTHCTSPRRAAPFLQLTGSSSVLKRPRGNCPREGPDAGARSYQLLCLGSSCCGVSQQGLFPEGQGVGCGWGGQVGCEKPGRASVSAFRTLVSVLECHCGNAAPGLGLRALGWEKLSQWKVPGVDCTPPPRPFRCTWIQDGAVCS